MHCRTFSSISVPYTLEANSTLWLWQPNCQIFLGSRDLSPLRNIGLTNDWAHKALLSLKKKKSILIMLNVTRVSSALQSIVLMSSRSEDWSWWGLMHSFSNHLLSGPQLHCPVQVAKRKTRKAQKATNAPQELGIPHREWKKSQMNGGYSKMMIQGDTRGWEKLCLNLILKNRKECG